MQLTNREELQEDWVKFTRFHFKEGWIDRWIGYAADNPNTGKTNAKRESKHRFYRLNDRLWEPDEYFTGNVGLTLINDGVREVHTADFIYRKFFTGPKEEPLKVTKTVSKPLETNDIQSIVSNSFGTKEMVEKLNNLLTTKEIHVIDSVMEVLDSQCDSYSRIVRKLTEMRGDAVARQGSVAL